MARSNIDSDAKGRNASGKPRLILAAALVAVSIVALAFQIRRHISPAPPERLYLSANVNLVPPPKVTADDRNATMAMLKEVEAQARTARREPNNGQAQLDLASKAIHANDPLTVRSALVSAIRIGVEVDPSMLDSLGQAQIDLGLCQEALATYNKSIARFPRNVTGYLGKAHSY